MFARVFVAAPLDDATRAACAEFAVRLRAHGWPGRWAPPENYHVTVAFLGSLDERRLAEIVAAVRAAVEPQPAFELRLGALGGFPNERRPRVAWVGPPADAPQFAALCRAVRGALGALDFAFDQPATPHVTLARADGYVALPAMALPAVATSRIEAVQLYESIAQRPHPRYAAIERFPLLG